jgi:hypothetical protein
MSVQYYHGVPLATKIIRNCRQSHGWPSASWRSVNAVILTRCHFICPTLHTLAKRLSFCADSLPTENLASGSKAEEQGS